MHVCIVSLMNSSKTEQNAGAANSRRIL